MDLTHLSYNELHDIKKNIKDEFERRDSIKDQFEVSPNCIHAVEVSKLLELVKELHQDRINQTWNSDDDQQYAYEALMQWAYGKDYFKKLDKLLQGYEMQNVEKKYVRLKRENKDVIDEFIETAKTNHVDVAQAKLYIALNGYNTGYYLSVIDGKMSIASSCDPFGYEGYTKFTSARCSTEIDLYSTSGKYLGRYVGSSVNVDNACTLNSYVSDSVTNIDMKKELLFHIANGCGRDTGEPLSPTQAQWVLDNINMISEKAKYAKYAKYAK